MHSSTLAQQIPQHHKAEGIFPITITGMLVNLVIIPWNQDSVEPAITDCGDIYFNTFT